MQQLQYGGQLLTLPYKAKHKQNYKHSHRTAGIEMSLKLSLKCHHWNTADKRTEYHAPRHSQKGMHIVKRLLLRHCGVP